MQKQIMHLKPEAIIKYLLGLNEDIDTLISCKSSECELKTTDQELYEALGSVPDKDKIDYNKLVKLLEVVDIRSHMQLTHNAKKILTHERVKQLRKNILREEDKNDEN